MALGEHTAQSLAEVLRSRLSTGGVEVARCIGEMTTYRVGGPAALFVEVDSESDLHLFAGLINEYQIPISVIGRGSNLLVADEGFGGIAVHLGESLAQTQLLDSGLLRVGASASLPSLARQLTAAGHRGFEWAVGVPGSVGGAVRMNAGGHGSDMAASVRSVRLVDLNTADLLEWGPAQMGFAYRVSRVESHHVVVSADLELADGDPAAGQELLAEIVAWRRSHQPGGQNAGSVFTNPDGDSAGRLIDAAGLKGFRIGSAQVSPKHANFIQADVGGRAHDIVLLMREMIGRVHDMSGVTLHAETRMLGFASSEASFMFDPGDRQ